MPSRAVPCRAVHCATAPNVGDVLSVVWPLHHPPSTLSTTLHSTLSTDLADAPRLVALTYPSGGNRTYGAVVGAACGRPIASSILRRSTTSSTLVSEVGRRGGAERSAGILRRRRRRRFLALRLLALRLLALRRLLLLRWLRRRWLRRQMTTLRRRRRS